MLRVRPDPVEHPEINALLLLLSIVRLPIDGRVPVPLLNEQAFHIRTDFGKEVNQLPAKEIVSDHADGAHRFHAQIHQIVHHIGRATEAIPLRFDRLRAFARLQGRLPCTGIYHPVRVETEIAEHGHAGGGYFVEDLIQWFPIHLIS